MMKKKLLLYIALLFPFAISASSIQNVILQEIKGAKVQDVSYESMPYQSATELTINTDKGIKKIILSPKNLVKALQILQEPTMVGGENAKVASHILEKRSIASRAEPTLKSPAKLPPPGSAAIVASTVTSANQQASK